MMNPKMQRLVDSIANALHCRVIPTWRLEHLAYAEHLQALFRRHAIDTVLDVGANIGQYRDVLRYDVGFQGDIHSFEPLPHLAQQMRARRGGDRRWHIHEFALGAQAGTAEISVMAANTFSSMRSVSPTAPTQFSKHTEISRKQLIKVRRLDELTDELGLTRVHPYLKIDTQGFDLEVLGGAEQILHNISGLQIELAFQRIYQGVPDYREVLTQLEAWGYAVSAMFPVSSDERLRAVEFDCVMVRAHDANSHTQS